MIAASVTLTRRAFHRLGVGSAAAPIAAGTAAGQLALGLAVPLIARLYSAADIGVFAILLSYAQIAAILVTGRVEDVLPRLPSGRRWPAVRVVTRSIVMLAPVAAILIALLVGQGPVKLWQLIGLTLLVAALAAWNLSKYALLTTTRYDWIGFQRGSNGCITAIAQVIGGFIAPSSFTLLLTYAIGNVAAALMSVPALRTISRAYGGEPNAMVIREERLVRFGVTVGSAAVLSNLSIALPLIGASILFGNAAAGSFWLARRILMTQTRLIATAVSDATYAIAADSSPARIAALVWTCLRKLRTPAVLLAGFGLIAAPVMSWLTGDEHPDMGTIMLLMTAPAAVQFLTMSLSNVLLAMHLEHIRTLWNIGRLIGLFAVFWISLSAELSFVVTVGIFALYMAVAYAILLALIAQGARQFATK